MARIRTVLRGVASRWALLLPAFAYLWLFPYLPELRSPNELCRLHQTRALVDHGTLEINRTLAEHGWVGDLSCVAVHRAPDGTLLERRDCPSVRGRPDFSEQHYFPSKAPLLSFAAAPVYRALKAFRAPAPVPEFALVFFARLFVTVLPAVLLLIPLRRFLRAHASQPVADALTATYALGSLAFSYAELFMSHQTTAVLLFLCFFALWRTGRGEWGARGFAVSGLLAGLTVAAEYTAALGLLPLAAYGLAVAPGGWRGRTRAAGLALAGALPVVLALAAYHAAAFGHPLASGYKFLNDAAYQGWHRGGFLGIGLPDARALLLSFFSPLRGLFALSPFLLFALPGFAPRFWVPGRRRELGAALALLALWAYFTASFSYDSWGWTTGPRHLTPLVPFLLLPAALFFEACRDRPLLAGLGAGLCALSVLATGAMTLLNYVPDSLTNALWQVALPFAAKGYWPHSWLSLAGVQNPWAALPAILAIVATAGLSAHRLLSPRRPVLSAGAAAGALLLVVLVHASARPGDEAARARDLATYDFLEQRYLPRPGQPSPPLFPER